jgi:Flp pilus assembly pilin Flp
MRHQTGPIRIKGTSRGQTMAEYALILVTIAVVATALVHNAGTIILTLVGEVAPLF